MLKWSGDYSLPRLRAKLATTGAGTEQTEPDYAEVYRPDLGQSTILRKESPEFFAAVAETGGFEAFARSSGCRVLRKGASRSFVKTGSLAGRTSLSQSTSKMSGFEDLSQTSMMRTRSVPTLGSRMVEKWPAAVQPLPPTWHVSSTSSLPGLAKSSSKGSLGSKTVAASASSDDPKEKQIEAACRKLWTAVHGSEKYIKDEIKRLQKEEPGATNQAFLAKLNKADSSFPSVKKALKTGAKIDWRNPEWDGATLLLRAARTGSLELAMFCLSQQANIAEKDNSGRGVLHWAALSGNNFLMHYFLTEYREQLNVVQEDGKQNPSEISLLAVVVTVRSILEHTLVILAQGIATGEGAGQRPLFWQTVGNVPDESIWSRICKPVPFDAALLERRFALTETRAAITRKGASGNPSGDEARRKVRVLDDRTSQLLAIAFNKLPPAEHFAQTVESLDAFPEGLPPEALIALHAASVDQKEAVEQLRHMDIPESDILQLDVPERYLWVLANRPLCTAKVACGALMFGLAPELPELGLACERVITACTALRTSELISQCISTCLAVGNAMNRGTARDGARAVVLPDGLLKLEELRGNNEADGVSGQSLLDFVAEAIVLEAVCQSNTREQQAQLRTETWNLRESVRAAQGVCIQEAETNCQRVCLAASRAHFGLAPYLPEPSVGSIAVKVSSICEEAQTTSQRIAAAKEDLKSTMCWLSAKPSTSPSEWLGNWVQFLDQLTSAIERVQLPESLPQHFRAEDQSRQLQVVRLLLGADAKETPNAGGFTPTQLAEAKRMWHVVRHLRENQNDDVVKERLGHIMRYNKTEEAEEDRLACISRL
ncbi:FH3 [Symbiodinium sp. KB8]|nr:FH3 [Symbiodinium sp. KB8]